MRTETLTFKAIFTGLVNVEGENFTRAGYCVRSRRPDGTEKIVSSLTPVNDLALLKKLETLNHGDVIEITIETRWNEPGIPSEVLALSVTGRQEQQVA